MDRQLEDVTIANKVKRWDQCTEEDCAKDSTASFLVNPEVNAKVMITIIGQHNNHIIDAPYNHHDRLFYGKGI